MIQAPQKLLRVLTRLRTSFQTFDALGERMTVSHAVTFLTVAMSEGRSLRDYCELLSAPQSTISRHLLDLGIRNRKREPGLGLIAQEEDPHDARRNIYTLTKQGRSLVQSITTTIADHAEE